jgi:hypothetical protein
MDMLVTVVRRDAGAAFGAVRDGSVVLPQRLPVATGPAGAPPGRRGAGFWLSPPSLIDVAVLGSGRLASTHVSRCALRRQSSAR